MPILTVSFQSYWTPPKGQIFNQMGSQHSILSFLINQTLAAPLHCITASTTLLSITSSTHFSPLLSSPTLPPPPFCHLYFAICFGSHHNHHHCCSPNLTTTNNLLSFCWHKLKNRKFTSLKTMLLLTVNEERKLNIEFLSRPHKSIFRNKYGVLTEIHKEFQRSPPKSTTKIYNL